MIPKIILGFALAAVFAVSFVFAQSSIATDDRARHLDIVDTDIETATDNGEEFLKATIKAAGPINNNGQLGAYGYGLLNDGTNNVLALTTHMCASDSPVQGNVPNGRCPAPVGLLDEDFTRTHDGPLFHAHVLDLKAATQACIDATGNADGLEVDVGSSLATNGGLPGVSPDYPIKVSGNTITVGNVPTAALGDNSVEAVVSFEIVGVATGNTITNLCVTNINAS